MQRKVGLLLSVSLFLCITPSQWTPCTKLLAESLVAVSSVISMRLDSATTSRGCFNAQLHLITFPQSPQFFSPALEDICNSLMLTVLRGPSYFPTCNSFFSLQDWKPCYLYTSNSAFSGSVWSWGFSIFQLQVSLEFHN